MAKAASAVQDGDGIAALTVMNLTANGDLTMLGRNVKSRDAASVGPFGAAFGEGTTAGEYGAAFGANTEAGYAGAAFGYNTVAGDFGAAFGVDTTADRYGAAFGYGTTAGDYGAAFGAYTTAGDYGFSAGRDAHGSAGSFVFADSAPVAFNRTNSPNSFNVRAAGGVHFLIGTNWLTATNDAQTNLVLTVAGSPVLTEETDPTAVLADGTRPMTGSLDMGGNEVTGIGGEGGLLNLGHDMGRGGDFGLTYEGTEIATVVPVDGTNFYFYGNRAVSIIEGAMYVGDVLDTESGSDLVRIDTTSIGGWGSQIAFEEGFIEGIGSWYGDLTFYNNEGETNTVDFSNVSVSGLENRVIANGDATMYWAVVDSTQLVFIANGVTNVVDPDITTP